MSSVYYADLLYVEIFECRECEYRVHAYRLPRVCPKCACTEEDWQKLWGRRAAVYHEGEFLTPSEYAMQRRGVTKPTKETSLLFEEDSIEEMNFGKYEGTSLEDVPTDYLEWAVDVGAGKGDQMKLAIREEYGRR